ncbi:lysoplasmalogenase [Trebonia kvetii]|uniref:Lysoplasmalogenase n=1 Tax=Trebonia kvetii TaxID=2480626 RepID=A0A6P2C3C8_9ACTN|nr:lysoplasmalogenase [Trebonia kvetii]TVZ04986.1 lysoplasmalogenase [Trebonia kvetii]
MSRLTGRARARALAGLYAALGIANSAAAANRFRTGEWATKPLLMPVLTAFALVAAGDRKQDVRLPAAGMVLSGLGDTALLGSESWFVPGMGAFAAAHACYIAALARDGAARGVRPRVAACYAAAWAVLIAVLWRGLGSLRVPVAAYSLLLVAMAVLASGRNREAAAGGALFVVSDALIACGLAGVNAVPRQESAVMPTYVAAQFLLAAGFLRSQRGTAEP